MTRSFSLFQHESPQTQRHAVEAEERDGVHAPEVKSHAGVLQHQSAHRHRQIPGAESDGRRYHTPSESNTSAYCAVYTVNAYRCLKIVLKSIIKVLHDLMTLHV